MKNLLFLCALLFVFSNTSAQSGLSIIIPSQTYEEAADSIQQQMTLANPFDTTEGGDINGFRRLVEFSGNRACTNGPAGSSVMAPSAYALTTYLQHLQDYCTGSGYAGAWQCTGPFNNYYGGTEYQGRIECIWVDPADTDYILAGSNAGGMWKSTNGGHSWHNISDAGGSNGTVLPGTMGVNMFTVDPLNRNYIYVSTGQGGIVAMNSWAYNMGLAYTKDGGQSWALDTAFDNVTNQSIIGATVGKIAYMPSTQKLFAYLNTQGNAHVYYKSDTNGAWQDITPATLPAGIIFNDMEFTVHTPGKVVFSSNARSNSADLWTYDYTQPPGSQWSNLAITLPATYYLADTVDLIGNFSISSGDTAFMLVAAHKTSDHSLKSLLVSSSLATSSPQVINAAMVYQYIKVSPANPKIIYATLHNSSNNFYQSTDGGVNFGTIEGSTHADGRYICIYSATNTSNGINDVLYGGTDGGVVKKRAGRSYFESITGDSLCITQFYGFSNTEADENIMTGGTQDDGGMTYIKNRSLPWHVDVPYTDAYQSKFLNNGIKEAFGEQNAPELYQVSFSGTSSSAASLAFPSGEYCGWPSDGCNNWVRPIYFTSNNTPYIGYSQVWKWAGWPSTGSWKIAFSANPMLDRVSMGNRKICDFILSSATGDTAYVAYRFPAYEDPTNPSNDTSAKLYVSFSDTSAFPNWINITPSIVQSDRINSIVTDPEHLNRIWVAFGNIDWDYVFTPIANMKNRIWYSDDYGSTWQDLSTGLSPLPVNKLIYEKGSDDVLFAATDAGVYKWDKTASSWSCFNNGLAPCVVSDIDINYCADKLRIATFGRGIWESPLHSASSVPGFATEMTANTTWTQNVYQTGSILVDSGVTFTIQNDTLHMPKAGRIAVKPGGKLVIDHAVITNDCQSCFWHGIEAWGHKSKPQINTKWQGVVIIKNGSLLQHADIAVANHNTTDSLYTGDTTTGGIIQAMNSTFLNNHRSASFGEYHNVYPPGSSSTPVSDQSYFLKCTFNIDNNYKGDSATYPFAQHCDLYKVQGVSFSACTFKTTKHQGTGILVYDAGCNIVPYNPGAPYGATGGTPTTFSGFTYAVDAEGDMDINPTVTIDQAIFDTCTVGVLVSGHNSVATTRSTFRVGNGPSAQRVIGGGGPCYENLGIFEKNVSGFTIEGNTFSGRGTGVSNFGVAIQNSSRPTVVYRNTFDTLTYACYAADRNREATSTGGWTDKGLRFVCNTYKGNNYDIYISATDPTDPSQCIAASQGTVDTSASNTFLTPAHIVNTNNYTISYWCTGGNSWPDTVTNVFRDSLAAHASHCFSSFGSAGPVALSPAGLGALLSSMAGHKAAWRSANNSYVSLIDGGNTASLLSFINSAQPQDSTTLFNMLMGYSPYVSDASLRAVGIGTKLSYAKYFTVLCNNPEVMRNNDLLTFIGSGIPFPIQLADITKLQDTAYVITSRTNLESSICNAGNALYSDANRLLTGAKADTISIGRTIDTIATSAQIDSTRIFTYLDTVVTALDTLGDLYSTYDLVGVYYSRNDLTSASSTLSSISSQYSLTSAQSGEYTDYQSLSTIFSSIASSNKNIFQLSPTQVTTLNSMASGASIDNGKVIAGNVIDLLVSVGSPLPPGPTLKLPCPYDLPGFHRKPANGEPLPFTTVANGNDKIIVYPNPAKDNITFKYELESGNGNAYLEITNVVGSKIADYTIRDKSGMIRMNINDLPDGIYIYRLSGNKGALLRGKFTIAR